MAKCPKCGSENVIIQREQSSSVGGSIHSFGSGKGCLYWLLIGWWFWMFKFVWYMMITICTFGLYWVFRKRRGLRGTTISANKVFNRTVAVCQSCGNHWKV